MGIMKNGIIINEKFISIENMKKLVGELSSNVFRSLINKWININAKIINSILKPYAVKLVWAFCFKSFTRLFKTSSIVKKTKYWTEKQVNDTSEITKIRYIVCVLSL
jgi:hypothetical protein